MPEKKMLVSLVIDAKNRASKAFEEVNKELGTVTGRLDMARKAAAKWDELEAQTRRVGIAMTGMGIGLLAVAKAGVSASMSMEGYRAKLEVVLKSRAKANQMMQWAKAKAAESPFDVSGVVDAVARLESYGLKATEWFDKVGDMAGAMGRNVTDAVEAIADAVSGGGLERLKEFGISATQLLGYGAKAAGGGGVDAASAMGQRRLKTALSELLSDRFRGGMEKYSETLGGKLSNLQDAITNTAAAIGDKLTPSLKRIVPILSEMVSWVGDLIETPAGQWCVKLASALGLVLVALGPLVVAWGSYIKLSAYAKIAFGEQGVAGALSGLIRVYNGLTWAKLKDIAISIADTAANLTLAGALTAVAAAAQAAWKALLGPLGILLAILGLLAGAVALVVRHFENKANAAKDAADGTDAAAKAAQEALDKFQQEQKALERSGRAYAEAQKEYGKALEERRRAERDAAIAVRDARESLEEALKGQTTAQREAAEAVQEAEQATTQAREDAAEAAVKASRDIAKAEEDAAATTRRAVEDTVRAETDLAKSKKKVAEAERDIARAMAKGRGDINKAQQDAAQRVADAERRLRDAQLTAAGVRETEAQRNARSLLEAQQSLAQARREGEESVAQARQKAAEDTARALEQWQAAQEALLESEQELAEVQAEAPKRIAEAEQQLADARLAAAKATQEASDKITEADAALVKAREDASERIIQADRALRNAQEALIRAQEDAVDRVAQAIERVATALDNMNRERAKMNAAAPSASPKEKLEEALADPDRKVPEDTRGRLRRMWDNFRQPRGSGVGPNAVGSGGGRAAGGPVFAGSTYLVGERGPELFTAPAMGNIIPNAALGGRTVVVNFNAPIYGEEALRQVARYEVGNAIRVAAYA